jgi:hypothetical protein
MPKAEGPAGIVGSVAEYPGRPRNAVSRQSSRFLLRGVPLKRFRGMHRTRGAHRPPRPGGRCPRDWCCFLVCLGAVHGRAMLDLSIVNVALPVDAARTFGFTTSRPPVGHQRKYTLTVSARLPSCEAWPRGRRCTRRLCASSSLGLALFHRREACWGVALRNQGPLLGRLRAPVQGLGGAVLAHRHATPSSPRAFASSAARARALGVWSAVAAGGGGGRRPLGTASLPICFVVAHWILFVNVPSRRAGDRPGRLMFPWARVEGRPTAPQAFDLQADPRPVTAGLVSLVWAIVQNGDLRVDVGRRSSGRSLSRRSSWRRSTTSGRAGQRRRWFPFRIFRSSDPY